MPGIILGGRSQTSQFPIICPHPKEYLLHKSVCVDRWVGTGVRKGVAPSHPWKSLIPHIFMHGLSWITKTVEKSQRWGWGFHDGGWVSTCRRISGKCDNTLEMAGRVPGKRKSAPGSNVPGRNLNSHPFAWRVQLAKECCITLVPAGHFHCHGPRPVFTSRPFTSCLCVYIYIYMSLS